MGTKLDTALAALSAMLRGCGRANRQLAAKTRKSLHPWVPDLALVRNPRSLIGARHRWTVAPAGGGEGATSSRETKGDALETKSRDPQMIAPASLT